MNQKGVVALAVPLLFLLIATVVVFILVSQGIIKIPLKNINLPGVKKEATVSLQTQYQNPFDKSAQYVNPFSEYKNPFDNLK
ncbi:hypothetical protein HYS96_03180 [Candidatus Daviesbacteria bacterium]|nr:hypothetical protein [Candidatus Daviesbacteria bacterium]